MPTDSSSTVHAARLYFNEGYNLPASDTTAASRQPRLTTTEAVSAAKCPIPGTEKLSQGMICNATQILPSCLGVTNDITADHHR